MKANNADRELIKIGDKEYTFCITPYGMMLADDMGMDILQEFDKLTELQRSGKLSAVKAMKVFTAILWVGIVDNHPEVTLEQVRRSAKSLNELASFSELIGKHMNKLVTGDALGEAAAPTVKGRKIK